MCRESDRDREMDLGRTRVPEDFTRRVTYPDTLNR